MNMLRSIIAMSICALVFEPTPSGHSQEIPMTTQTAPVPAVIPLSKIQIRDSLRQSIREDKEKINNLIKVLKQVRSRRHRPEPYKIVNLPAVPPPVKYDLKLKHTTDTLDVDIDIPYTVGQKKRFFNFLKFKRNGHKHKR